MKKAILIGLLAIFGAGLLLANVTFGDHTVRPSRGTGTDPFGEPYYVPADAGADGTANTCFSFLIHIETGNGEVFWDWPTLHIGGRDYPMWLISGTPRSGVWCATAYGVEWGAPLTGGPRTFLWYVTASSAQPSATSAPDIVISDFFPVTTTGIDRAEIYPEGGAYGQGLYIEPYDQGHPDAGSSSCVYTFKVRYKHYDGLPPRAFVNTDWDGLSYVQDNWRDVGGDYPSKTQHLSIYYVASPVVWIKDRANNEKPERANDYDANGEATGVWIPHFMIVDSPNKPLDQITGADYRNGVVYKYTVRPTEYFGYFPGQYTQWNLWTVSYSGSSMYTVHTNGTTTYAIYPQRIVSGMSGTDGRTYSNHYTSFGDFSFGNFGMGFLGAQGYREPKGHDANSQYGYPTRRLDDGLGNGRGAGWDYTFSQGEINYYFEATPDFRPYNFDGDDELNFIWEHHHATDVWYSITGEGWIGEPYPYDSQGRDRYDYTRYFTISKTSYFWFLSGVARVRPDLAAHDLQVPEQLILPDGKPWKPFRAWNFPVLNQGGFSYGYTGWKYGDKKHKDRDPMEGVSASPLVQIETFPLEVWVPAKITPSSPDGTLLLSVDMGNETPYKEVCPIPRPATYKWRRVPSSSKVRFWVKYTQPFNIPPSRVRVLIYDYQNQKWMEYYMLHYDGAPNDGDYRNGEWFYYEMSLPPGKYATFFDAKDNYRTAKFPNRPDDDPAGPNPNNALYWVRDVPPNPPDLNVNPDPWDNPVGNDYLPGPWVNNDPVVWGESLTPTSGSSGTTFTWLVNYKDADNDPPRFALLVINKVDRNTQKVLETRRFQMTRLSWLGQDNDWKTGAVFQYVSKYFNPETQEVFDPQYLYNYHFEFTDDWGEPYYPETGCTVRYPASYEIWGPDITFNNRPYFTDATLSTSTGVMPAPQVLITWRTIYNDRDNDPPAFVKIILKQGAPDPNDPNKYKWRDYDTIRMEQENPQDTLYIDGASFYYTGKLPYVENIYYAAEFVANDGKDDDRPSVVNLPYSNGMVSITAMSRALGNVSVVKQGAIIVQGTIDNAWSLIYKDSNGTPPQKIEVIVSRRISETNWQPIATIPMTPQSGDYAKGVSFIASTPLLAFDETNFYYTYKYVFRVTLPDGKAADINYEGPFILGPLMTQNIPPVLLTPTADPRSLPDDSKVGECISPRDPATGISTGGLNDSFTYTVQFVDRNNQFPSYIKVVVDFKTEYPMVEVDPNDKFTMDGKLYRVTLKGSDLGVGQHYFHFEASDGTDTVRFPKADANFPANFVVNGEVQLPYINDKPAISNIAVSTDTGVIDTTPFRFTATYSDANNDAPKYIRVVVEKKQDSSWVPYSKLDMSKVDPNAVDYIKGVDYERIATFSEEGEYRFSIEASDGREYNDYARAPEEAKRPVFRVVGVLSVLPTLIDIGADPTGVVTIGISSAPNQTGHLTVTNPKNSKVIDKDFQTTTQGTYTEQVSPDMPGQWNVSAKIGDKTYSKTFTVIITHQFGVIDMSSIPFNLEGQTITDIFGSTFDPKNIAYYDPVAKKYVSGNEAGFPTLVPGLGFWLKGPVTATLQKGTKVTGEFRYALKVDPQTHMGWNIVGSPFTKDLDISQVLVAISPTAQPISLLEASKAQPPLVKGYFWGYDPRLGDYVLIHPALSGDNRILKPWKGYWIKALKDSVYLVFSPTTKSVEARDVKPEGWRVQLIAQSSSGKDTCNYLGMGDSRLLSGVEEPPALSGVQLYFLRNGEKLAWDVREKAERAEWDVVVEGAGEITLSWPNLSQVPKGYGLFLIDGDKRINMLTSSRYVFSSDGHKELKVVYERRASSLLISGLMAKAVRGGVNVSFSLSDSAEVKVSVKGVDGRLIKEMTRSGVAGLNSVVWDGKDAEGKPLPAGVYLLEVIARSSDGSFVRGITMFNLR